MKTFLTSLTLIIALALCWGIFENYSDAELHSYANKIDEVIIPAVTSGDWDFAEKEFESLTKNWHKYKKRASYFYSTDALNDADYTIARSKYFIKQKDPSNASGELACLYEQLKFLHLNESVSPENIL